MMLAPTTLLQIEEIIARIENKVDHLTGLVEEVLAYLDGMDEQKRGGDEWKEE